MNLNSYHRHGRDLFQKSIRSFFFFLSAERYKAYCSLTQLSIEAYSYETSYFYRKSTEHNNFCSKKEERPRKHNKEALIKDVCQGSMLCPASFWPYARECSRNSGRVQALCQYAFEIKQKNNLKMKKKCKHDASLPNEDKKREKKTQTLSGVIRKES